MNYFNIDAKPASTLVKRKTKRTVATIVVLEKDDREQTTSKQASRKVQLQAGANFAGEYSQQPTGN